MKEFVRYFLILIGLVILIWALIFFKAIVGYIIISFVISIIGRPIVDFLGKLKIKNIKLPRALRAALTLAFIWFIIITFFRVFVPLIANEANDLSQIDVQAELEKLDEPIQKLEDLYNKMVMAGEEKPSFQEFVTEKAGSLINIKWLSDFISKVAGTLVVSIYSQSFLFHLYPSSF